MNASEKELEVFHKKCERVTGNPWCPYPSEDFILAVLLSDDDTARTLIEKRREFIFPHFLGNEPMEKEIRDIFREYGV